VAYNLRRFYNFRGAFPLDWWITQASGVVEFLRRPDAGYLYDQEQLELPPSGKAVHHRSLGFNFNHEFPRDGSQPGYPVRSGWRDLIEEPRRRTVALIGKFLGLNAAGNRVAFVREDAETVDAIGERLDTLFPLADYTLIVLPRISGNERDPSGWKGDPALWDKALGDLNLSLDRTNHQPFEESAKIIHDDQSGAISRARQKQPANNTYQEPALGI